MKLKNLKLNKMDNGIIKECLGWNGAMISGSKSGYLQSYPNNVVVFNSNICTEGGKVWYGDIDITKSKDSLIKLAEALDSTLYVLLEMDGRFENEAEPKVDKYVAKIEFDGSITFGNRYKDIVDMNTFTLKK